MKKRAYIFVGLLSILGIVFISIFGSIAKENAGIATSEKIFFEDVDDEEWYYPNIIYVFDKGLMNGTSDTLFSPNESTTRGMIATILWRLDGNPSGNISEFDDVKSGSYYYDAIAWAFEHEIVNGYSDTIFGPDDPITREQLATMMYRYARYKSYDVSERISLEKYSDVDQISDYAVPAFEWANASEIVTGVSENILEPQSEALRSHVAAILERFCKKFVFIETEEESDQNHEEENINNSQDEIENSDAEEFIQSPTIQSSGTVSGSSNISNIPTDDSAQELHASIVVDSVSAKPGDTVRITASINNNPGILGMTLTAYYDESVCTLQNVENGEAFQDILDFTSSKTLDSGVKFVWDGIEISDEDVRDGSILIMDFLVHDNAEKGEFPINIEYSDGDIVDNELINVYPQIEIGHIIIE